MILILGIFWAMCQDLLAPHLISGEYRVTTSVLIIMLPLAGRHNGVIELDYLSIIIVALSPHLMLGYQIKNVAKV